MKQWGIFEIRILHLFENTKLVFQIPDSRFCGTSYLSLPAILPEIPNHVMSKLELYWLPTNRLLQKSYVYFNWTDLNISDICHSQKHQQRDTRRITQRSASLHRRIETYLPSPPHETSSRCTYAPLHVCTSSMRRSHITTNPTPLSSKPPSCWDSVQLVQSHPLPNLYK